MRDLMTDYATFKALPASERDRLRVLGAPMPGFTSGGRRADQD